MKKIAIKPHKTRGKEVISILEKNGGVNCNEYSGTEHIEHPVAYYVAVDHYIVFSNITFLEQRGYKIYTLEEWEDECKSDEMIEGLVEEESANYSKVIDNGVSNPIIAKTSSATIDTDKGFYSYSDSDDNLEMEWNLPEGYIFKDENGNVINATKIVLEKKKKYPKTYDKCCEVLGIGSYFEPEIRNATTEECHKFTKLIRLKRCRDAYWKIAGEEMGLGKPWEPDFEYDIYYIYYDTHKRIFSKDYCAYGINVNHFLVFPTEEMRDAFYENFKEDIEFVKEFL